MIFAVNGDLWLDNIYCFSYRIKFNNPLMGTEELFVFFFVYGIYLLSIKFNNPLMGTEEYLLFYYPLHKL